MSRWCTTCERLRVEGEGGSENRGGGAVMRVCGLAHRS